MEKPDQTWSSSFSSTRRRNLFFRSSFLPPAKEKYELLYSMTTLVNIPSLICLLRRNVSLSELYSMNSFSNSVSKNLVKYVTWSWESLSWCLFCFMLNGNNFSLPIGTAIGGYMILKYLNCILLIVYLLIYLLICLLITHLTSYVSHCLSIDIVNTRK